MIEAVQVVPVTVLVKLAAVAFVSVTSPAAKPVTGSENVNVAVNAAIALPGTPMMEMDGSVVS